MLHAGISLFIFNALLKRGLNLTHFSGEVFTTLMKLNTEYRQTTYASCNRYFNSLTDVMNGNSKTFSVVSKDMIEEKFSDVHGVSVVFLIKSEGLIHHQRKIARKYS